MRRSLLLAGLAVAACSSPPRVLDRSTPVQAYRTFRGAMARGEYEREFECLSEGLRARIGRASWGEWKDARELLGPGHTMVRGIVRSRVDGEPERLEDGRIQLRLRVDILFLTFKASVVMSKARVLRVFVAGSEDAWVHQHLPALTVEPGEDRIALLVPPEIMEWVRKELTAGQEVERFVAAVEWFLDDFAIGDATPSSVRKTIETR